MKTALAPALAAALVLVGRAAALGTNYAHDGATTYCWAIPRSPRLTNLAEADRTTAYSTRAECPIALTLTLAPPDTVASFAVVNVTWTAQVDFSSTSNAINNTLLYYGPDSAGSSGVAQIVHSNVHSCVFGTGCDPFSDGKELVDKTVNKIANFTDNRASFSDSLRFPEPGEYSVLAHIILPNFNASSRFDYAVYSKLTVLAATAAPARTPTAAPATAAPVQTPAADAKSSSGGGGGGLSHGATIAVIIGAIVVVVALAVIVVLLRRHRGGRKHGGYVAAPVADAGDAARPSGPAGFKASDVTDSNSTSGFQSAWGGGGGGAAGPHNQYAARSTGGGYDYAPPAPAGSYHNQYAPPRPSEPRAPSDIGSVHLSDMTASDYYGQAPNPQRKKRVESDIEL